MIRASTTLNLACALAPALLLGCAATSQGQRAQQDNRETVAAAFDRWRSGTGGPFELLAPNARWTIVGSSPLSKTYPNRDAFLREVIEPFNARLRSPLVPTVREIMADGDRVVVRFDALATARDGVPYRNTYSWHLRVEDGRIVDAVAFFDTRLFDEFWSRVAPAR